MPQNRFQFILKFLHFNDKTFHNPKDPETDRVYKIWLVVECLVSKFKTVYMPEHVAIYEELLLWKGRVGFKQCIPSKTARFDIKMFSLWGIWKSLEQFCLLGKDPSADNNKSGKGLGKSGAVVPKLQVLYGKSNHLYSDILYIHKKLFSHFEQNGTAVCGTTRLNPLKIPPSLKRQEMEITLFAKMKTC